MKSFLLALGLLVVCLFSSAQKIAIYTDRNNVLFQEMDNPVTIVVEKQSCKDLYVTTDNGTITGSNGLYVCKPDKVGRALITVSVKKNGKLKWVGSLPFRVKYLIGECNLFFKVGPCGNGCYINKKVLQAQEYSRVELEGTDFDVKFGVDSFMVCIISYGSDVTKQLKNIGQRIAPTVKAAFATLKDGDVVLFKEIYALGPDGRSMQVKPAVMFVKE